MSSTFLCSEVRDLQPQYTTYEAPDLLLTCTLHWHENPTEPPAKQSNYQLCYYGNVFLCVFFLESVGPKKCSLHSTVLMFLMLCVT